MHKALYTTNTSFMKAKKQKNTFCRDKFSKDAKGNVHSTNAGGEKSLRYSVRVDGGMLVWGR